MESKLGQSLSWTKLISPVKVLKGIYSQRFGLQMMTSSF